MKTDEEYLACGGLRCPRCNSNDIRAEDTHVDGTTASQEVYCESCDFAWYDVYRLVGFEPMHPRD